MVEGILGMVIEEKLEEKLEERLRTIQQVDTRTFTSEEICYLDLVKGNVSLHVIRSILSDIPDKTFLSLQQIMRYLEMFESLSPTAKCYPKRMP